MPRNCQLGFLQFFINRLHSAQFRGTNTMKKPILSTAFIITTTISMYQYQETKTYECDGSYTSRFAYRCASGAYGTARGSSYSIGNLSGCSRCPSGGTSSAGSTSITSCYIPSGTAFNETSGTGTYTQNCYYKN